MDTSCPSIIYRDINQQNKYTSDNCIFHYNMFNQQVIIKSIAKETLQWKYENMYDIDSNNDTWLKNTQFNIKTHDWLNLRARKGLELEYGR